MSKKTFTSGLAALLIIALVAPATFFITPQRASAAGTNCIGGLIGMGITAAIGLATSVLSVPIANMPIEGATASAAGSTAASCIYEAIVVPAAQAVIRALLAQITASTINWITGRNSSGQASFVRNISVNLQIVGDATAIPFFNQVKTGFNSPFGPVISSALQLQYAQQTSRAGFFAANQNTRYSQNPNAFINGTWSQGGMKAWFALTGPNPNNPYILYQAAQTELGNSVGQAQTNRRQDMVQSSGFLSWCGESSAAVDTSNVACPSGQTLSSDTNQCYYSGGDNSGQFSGVTPVAASARGISPGDSCFNSDGIPGTIQTPGSAIHGYTQKAVVGLGIDQLISAKELDNAFGAIVGALMSQVIGGVTGLFGATQPSNSGNNRSSIVTQLQQTSGISAQASGSSGTISQSSLSNISNYTSAWNTITTAANTASTTLDSLAIDCRTAANDAEQHPNLEEGKTGAFVSAARAQASAALTAIAVSIAPVIAQARSAISSVQETRTLATRVDTESAAAATNHSTTADATAALNRDIATLATMPPSISDVLNAQSAAAVTNTAVSLPRPVYPDTTPTVSLSVSGGSLVDQMNLLSTNAEALRSSVCIPVPSTTANDNGSGGD